MKITLIQVGKTEESWLKEGIDQYAKRLKHYLGFSVLEIPGIRNTGGLTPEQQKEKEGELILKALVPGDRVYLLDEKGREYDSRGLASLIQTQMNASVKNTVFVIGGAFGFSSSVYERCEGKISLSKMTFTHQMVRLFYTEQLYRAMTILRGEKYHHD